MQKKSIIFIAALAVFMSCLCLYSMDTDKVVDVKVYGFYDPNKPDEPTTKALIEFMDTNPGVVVSQWGSIQLPGGGSRAPILMAIAGKTAPDIMGSWFHIISNDMKQGFLYPLNEWIGDDKNGNGQIDDSEAKWPGWKNIPPLWRQVATSEGKVYGIPQCSKGYMGIIYRIDMVRDAGLDPDKTPETWDELVYWCQKLTKPNKDIPGAVFKRGQRGICLQGNGFFWLPWMQSAGGDPIIQLRKSPKDGKEYEFPMDATTFITKSGEDLTASPPVWRANFASPAGIAAAGFYHRLRWMKWMFDTETNEPVNLTEDDLKNGYATVGDRKITFKESDIITGVARGQTGQRGTSAYDMLSRGEIAMLAGSVEGITGLGGVTGIDPNYLSWFPYPAKSKTEGEKVLQVQQHYAAMVEGVARRDKNGRDKVWEVLNAITSQKVKDEQVRSMVLEGLAKFVNPDDLTRLDFADYLKDIPPRIQNYYKEMQDGKIGLYTEPFMGFWLTMDTSISRSVLSLVIAETGENFDYASALKQVEHEANSGLMFGRTEKELDQYRPTARIIFVIVAIIISIITLMMLRSLLHTKGKAAPSTRNIQSSIMPWVMMIPALILIGLWSYYPLIRGMFMAFQDYRIVGNSRFTGLDNFISLALDSSFWVSL
ncbi:MAG: extracellular solute-binding protein [Victivallales bacterium]